jgi:hypothetical protein
MKISDIMVWVKEHWRVGKDGTKRRIHRHLRRYPKRRSPATSSLR